MSAAPPPGPASERRWLLPAAFVLLGTIWGSSFAWIKVAIEELPPATLVAERMALGAVAMLVLLAFTRPARPTRRQVGHLAVMGAVNAGLPIFLISWGEQYIDSGTAAVLNSLVPIFSLLIAGFVLKTEMWSLLRVTGILIGFAGAVVLASREFGFNPGPAAIGGALAVTVASLSYAIGASYAKVRIVSTDRYVVAGGTLVFAALYLTIVALSSMAGSPCPPSRRPSSAFSGLGCWDRSSPTSSTSSSSPTSGPRSRPWSPTSSRWSASRSASSCWARCSTRGSSSAPILVVIGIAIVGLRYDSVVSLATRVARR